MKKAFFMLIFICFPILSLYGQQHSHKSSVFPRALGTNVSKNKPAGLTKKRTVNLIVAYKWVNFTGKRRRAIAVNNQVPGPVLHFKEGDEVNINVYNHLDKGTTIHWHGILVPWQMDGVENVTQKAIPPQGVFHYTYTLHQSGTYWYHAHSHLQEQEGLYGAYIIDPIKPPSYHYTKDFTVVLSDWSNLAAHHVFANLKKDGDYYSPRFPLQPSLLKFLQDYYAANPSERKAVIKDYKMMQRMRMGIYDLSDIGYDAYLLNGRTASQPWTAQVKVGDVVRFRFIGAASSTIYFVKIPGTLMQLVHVQGNDVVPVNISNFSIAPGETVDVLVHIQKNKPYIIYAESIDTLGKAYGALLTHPHQFVNYQAVKPFPEPQPVTRTRMHNQMLAMMALQHRPMKSSMQGSMGTTMNMTGPAPLERRISVEQTSNQKNHSMRMKMRMPTEATIVGDKITPPGSFHAVTAGTKYENLVAAVKTNDPHKPVDGVIRMELFGYMGEFIWFINGVPEYKAKPIVIKPQKRYRIIFTNISMMRHPMHIHGHWFILRNGHGAYDPLLHTVEVPPGATAVVDLDTDASGQWFFHCHHLYHMAAGMARVFQYSTLIEIVRGQKKPENYIAQTAFINRPIVRDGMTRPLVPSLIEHPLAHPRRIYMANFIEADEDPFNNVQEGTFKGLYGPDYHKLELLSKEAEINKGKVEYADVDIFYWHLVSQFWAIKAGVNYFIRPGGTYWQPGFGFEGMMPYFIETDFRTYYHDSSVKFDVELSRSTQITNNFFIRLGVRSIAATKSVLKNEIGNGLNQMRYVVQPFYRLKPGLNVYFEYEHEQYYGLFRSLQIQEGDGGSEDTFSFGLAAIF